ncbi:co-chaperone GroES [Zavarzinia compransoris]|uniref:GroES family chaperonin n=1 Tax=Zavarzinia marina TaxID=2911065 RepID=UPI001F352958|nr:co-chaperone GroES [Zavarzinia marina]MCF4166343.1 co-chaperone GroES [Zavarzinia marina]
MKIDPSKIIPTEYRVLVKLDPIEEKTRGGIIVPDDTKERQQMAQIAGTLVAVGGNAFADWNEPIPSVGDRVLIAKYAGDRPPIDQRETYAIANDKDVVAIIG